MVISNRAKERLKDGNAVCSFGVTMPEPGVAQILASTGAEILTIDMEHGALDVSAVHRLVAATAGTDCVPVVRVPNVASSAIKPVLDAGALGIVFPMVRTKAEVEEGIAAMLYPPAGKRGIAPHFAPARWGVSASDYLACANDALLKIVLIETEDAVRNIEEILSVPGLDVATIAIGDLAANLGYPGNIHHPQVVQATRFVAKAVMGTPVALGGVALSTDDVQSKLESGYRFFVLGFDVGLLASSASALVAALSSKRGSG